MIKEKDEIQAEILRVTQSVVLYVPTYSKFGGYEGERSIYTADITHALYRAGYRKQSEGEWVKHEHDFWGVYYTCSACKCDVVRAKKYQFCPDCGAKMKGGEQG